MQRAGETTSSFLGRLHRLAPIPPALGLFLLFHCSFCLLGFFEPPSTLSVDGEPSEGQANLLPSHGVPTQCGAGLGWGSQSVADDEKTVEMWGRGANDVPKATALGPTLCSENSKGPEASVGKGL